MARLIVSYDPDERLVTEHLPESVRSATLDIPNDLEGLDIYERARKLAELLLEQID